MKKEVAVSCVVSTVVAACATALIKGKKKDLRYGTVNRRKIKYIYWREVEEVLQRAFDCGYADTYVYDMKDYGDGRLYYCKDATTRFIIMHDTRSKETRITKCWVGRKEPNGDEWLLC